MKENSFYLYRIIIQDKTNLRVEKRDFNGNLIGEPPGRMDYLSQKTLLARLCTLSRNNNITQDEIRELGLCLFNSFFDDNLKRDLLDLYEKVQAMEGYLRIELDIDENRFPDLVALPWEFLRASLQNHHQSLWFSTDPKLAFVRRSANVTSTLLPFIKENEKIKIAFVVSAPSSMGKVKYEDIWALMKLLEEKYESQVELLQIVDHARPELIDSVLKQKPHIFHFIGHGRRENNGEIALEYDTGEAMWKDAESFSDLFVRHRPVLVILQSCETASTNENVPFSSIASNLIGHNIPTVLAMQYEVQNIVAKRFILEFYKSLIKGYNIDRAVQEGRRYLALGSKGYATRDFAAPVIYSRLDNKNFRIFSDSSCKDLHQRINFSEIKRKTLEEELKLLIEEYETLVNQISHTISEVDRLKLQRQKLNKEKEITAIEKELDNL